MTRDERQDLAIERWKKAGGRGTLVAGTGSMGQYKSLKFGKR